MSHNIFEQLKLNSDKQIELLETISNRLKKEENKTLKMLSAIGPPFNEITPLMKAVDDGRLDVIKILLANKNVDVNFQNDSKLNALLLAVGFRVYQPDYPADKVVSLLLKAGAKLDVLSREGHPPIMESVLNNYPESFKLLFDQKIADKDSSDLDACLIAATEKGREKIVRYLLEHKISPKIKTAYGSTLLHLVKDNPEIAQLLLNAHLDVNAKNETGETGLHSLLAEVYYARVTPLKREEYNNELNPGILKVLNLYIKAGIKVNESSEYNTFPLNVAALYRSSEIVETLLKNGANVNTQSGEDSTTALMDASRYGRSDNVAVLLKYHADKNIRNTKGQTALDEAEDFLKYYKTRGDSMESYMIQRLENTILALKE